ncbi:DUF4097 family beta strand repeat-containing protein [Granulicella tundricola]|uniref:DUF4097 domain-containing protein n=1 Tax=Granulicella tundricola (strain ATCC BAA-1859 / DSM 23138 / MP5ACTX9) TaxID=1198114 RepID=E8WXN8_GRATM|nr:DUF4097 family beta strand repeat-containing protein [Granulicella tundricola]ADW68654.1 hypothetical protein AciX9_1601 [Granulicella tundricola MP5ACTX9]
MNKFSALLLATPLLLSGYAAASEPGSFNKTLTVSGPVKLDVKSGPGGIKISVGSSDTVVVHAVIRSVLGRFDPGLADANIRALEQNPPIEQHGNDIRIGYVADQAILKGVTVTYDIETPRQTQVNASADAGGIRIDGVQGPVETTNDAGHTEVSGIQAALKMTARAGGLVVQDAGNDVSITNQSGGILMHGVHGSVTAETTNGRIEISDVTGDVHSATRSASIRLDGIKGGVNARNLSGSIESFQSGSSVNAETSSGSIRISQSQPAPIRALSSSGAIHVELASGGGYDLDAQSIKGKISGKATEAFAKTKDQKDQRSFKGRIGSGGPLVDLDTKSSKIEID